ncbi:hypothetical protein Ancab_011516, partial [Ancistrocladus abbreviatus]
MYSVGRIAFAPRELPAVRWNVAGAPKGAGCRRSLAESPYDDAILVAINYAWNGLPHYLEKHEFSKKTVCLSQQRLETLWPQHCATT